MLLMPQNIGAGNSIYVKEPKIKNYNPNKPMHNLTTLLRTHPRPFISKLGQDQAAQAPTV